MERNCPYGFILVRYYFGKPILPKEHILYQYPLIALIPGRTLPSIISSKAPPPVET